MLINKVSDLGLHKPGANIDDYLDISSGYY